jgi:hypothetical protein
VKPFLFIRVSKEKQTPFMTYESHLCLLPDRDMKQKIGKNLADRGSQ